MRTTRIVDEVVLIPQPYLCERCGEYKVGYIDVVNDQFVGFYNFEKTPMGKDPDPELAQFRETVTIEQRRHRQPMKKAPNWKSLPLIQQNIPYGDPVSETIMTERLEENVCATCMHADSSFRRVAGIIERIDMPTRVAYIPAPPIRS